MTCKALGNSKLNREFIFQMNQKKSFHIFFSAVLRWDGGTKRHDSQNSNSTCHRLRL